MSKTKSKLGATAQLQAMSARAAALLKALEHQQMELQEMHEKVGRMGYVLTFIAINSEFPITIPMDWTAPTDFAGLDLLPDPENETLHVVPKYLPEAVPVEEPPS